ncbi:hypothetical protein PWG71_15970 [Nocardiopsis sp. N85]|uniref:hypothetical protein n=1 Tax=Nocardiopsis sp. N85 TaxID=3029400 RepID=UPI00237F1C81|nr:hypothetical protein [Nocardiopsis sp. N85]MDE3722887.1 hypothetical protein [Nocardiopsis sp. N85]
MEERKGIPVRACLLGLAAGSRASLGAGTALRAVPGGGPALTTLTVLGTVGEFIGDKTPFAPNRLEWAGLIPRVASAMVGGGLLARAAGVPLPPAVLIAGIAAPVGAWAGVTWREVWGRVGPDTAGALIEDAVALAVAGAAVRGLTREN